MARIKIISDNSEKTDKSFSIKQHKIIRRKSLFKRLFIISIIINVFQFLYIIKNDKSFFLTTILVEILKKWMN